MFSTTVTTKCEWNMYGILAKWIDLQCWTSECRVYFLLSSYAFSMNYTNVKQSEAKQGKARQSEAKQSKAKPSRTVMKEKKPNLCNICFHFITLRPCFFLSGSVSTCILWNPYFLSYLLIQISTFYLNSIFGVLTQVKKSVSWIIHSRCNNRLSDVFFDVNIHSVA